MSLTTATTEETQAQHLHSDKASVQATEEAQGASETRQTEANPLTSTCSRPVKKRKRDSFASWFHWRHKRTVVIEETNDDVLEERLEVKSVRVETEGAPVVVEEKSEDSRPFETSTHDEQTPEKISSFKRLFKRNRSTSRFNFDDNEECTLEKSKSIRERFFTLRKSTRKNTKRVTSDSDTSVLEANQTLTQRYMNNNYETLMDDLDNIPFDLTIEQPSSLRYHMSKKLQSWSPVKTPKSTSNILDGLSNDEPDTADESWNPYLAAKKFNDEERQMSISFPEGTVKPDDDHIGIKRSSRFGTLRRGLTMLFKKTEGDGEDEENEDLEEEEEQTTATDLDDVTSVGSFASSQNSLSLFNIRGMNPDDLPLDQSSVCKLKRGHRHVTRRHFSTDSSATVVESSDDKKSITTKTETETFSKFKKFEWSATDDRDDDQRFDFSFSGSTKVTGKTTAFSSREASKKSTAFTDDGEYITPTTSQEHHEWDNPFWEPTSARSDCSQELKIQSPVVMAKSRSAEHVDEKTELFELIRANRRHHQQELRKSTGW